MLVIFFAAFRLRDLGLVSGLRFLQACGGFGERLLALLVLFGLLLRELGVLARDLRFALRPLLGQPLGLLLFGLGALPLFFLALGFRPGLTFLFFPLRLARLLEGLQLFLRQRGRCVGLLRLSRVLALLGDRNSGYRLRRHRRR